MGILKFTSIHCPCGFERKSKQTWHTPLLDRDRHCAWQVVPIRAIAGIILVWTYDYVGRGANIDSFRQKNNRVAC